MRCGLWSRRLSRWRTRKSLPTDQAALRAASATARDVSRGRGLAGRAGERRCQATPPSPRRAGRPSRCPRRAHHLAAQVTGIRLEWMPKVVTAAAKSAEVAGAATRKATGDRRRDLPRTLCTRRRFVHQVTRNQAWTAQKVVISCAKLTEVTAVTGGRGLVRRVTELALGRPAWRTPARGGAGRIRLCGLARCR